jgi:hypothetical protein
MVRQAHTYLVGAMGGATLIAIAIAVFVLLVSAQVFRDWPIAALGNGDESAAVSTAHPAGGSVAGAAAGPVVSPGSSGASAKQNGAGSAATGLVAGRGGIGAAGVQAGAEQGGSGTATGGQGGSGAAGSPQSPNSSSPSGSTGSSSSGGGGGGGGSTSRTTSSPTGQVTETVNDTVSKVDESALGGTLNESGVTAVTEGAVNGVAGPESAVGKAVDETAGAVGGLLPGSH